MRTAPGIGIVIALATVLPGNTAEARAQIASDVPVQWTGEELENLLAPVALYPDPILAQVLVAASYPDEVELAAQHVRLYGQDHIDDQPWDISVRAVAHYEPVLNLMADRMDWTVALGQAYAEQPDDVMAAVQSLRALARAHGNLVSTREHEVVVEDRYIRILPAHPRVVYVPVYDPYVVYHQPVVHLGVYRSGWSFGIGFPIGVWLTYDFDWRRRHVYYHGWAHGYATGWIHRSRPFIVVNNIYIRPRPRVVVVNRRVIDRYVDHRRFDRYNYVHRRLAWDRARPRDHRRYVDGGPGWDRDRRPVRGIADGPSWDRRGRVWNGGDDRRAVPRSSAPPPEPRQASPPRPRHVWPQPTRPQNERAVPPTQRPRESWPQPVRPQNERAVPPTQRPRESWPQPARPQNERAIPPTQRPRGTWPQPARPRNERAVPPNQRPREVWPQPIRPQAERLAPPSRRARPQPEIRPRSEGIMPSTQRIRPPQQRGAPPSQRVRPPQRVGPERAAPPRARPQGRASPTGRTSPVRTARPRGSRASG